jgi:hypothetical protein
LSDSASSLFRTQYEFAARIRDPDNAAAPSDVEQRRMEVYEKLFYNNIQGFIRDGFPVLRRISDDDVWHARIRDFFVRHRCRSPYFVEISKEFVDFLAEERLDHPDDPPFILELAHYEWVELALRIAEDDEERGPFNRNGDLLVGNPIVSAVAWPLSYRYPVHRISPNYQPEEVPEKPTFLVVYRDRDDNVKFLEINAVTYRLLELLRGSDNTHLAEADSGQPLTGRQALQQVAGELNDADSDEIVRSGEAILNQMRRREIIIGAALQPK